MRRLVAITALLGLLLTLGFGLVTAAPAAAEGVQEIEIVIEESDPASSHADRSTESAVTGALVLFILVASAAGPWMMGRSAREFDERLRPLPLRIEDHRFERRQR